MSHMIRTLIGLAGSAAFMAAFSLQAAPLIQKNISQEEALMGYEAMRAQCPNGANITVVIVDRAGLVALAARPDTASPHNLELARRKAYTGRTFRSPSIEWRDRSAEGTATSGQRMLTDVIPLGGGFPIMVGNDAVGGVGVSGAAGGQPGDNACAKIGADVIAADMQ